MDNKYLSVTALTRYLKHKFDIDENLRNVYIKGEISNFKAHTTGHFYFSIKDENSKINAIMFKTKASTIKFTPVDGMKVLINGRVSIYEATGGYQIYVDEMLEDGVGNLYLAFEQLKEKLQKEGLFDSKYKKQIPKIPQNIGVVTASTGAAIKDIVSTINRRFPICNIYLFPALVQGDAAGSDIVKKIKQAQNYNLDVLIVGRGGGSIEDLWPFNEEIVAHAIFDCPIPVISAVGHEIDYTIADFVADLRAPTPTGAAELAVPNIVDVKSHLSQLKIRLNNTLNEKLNYNKVFLNNLKNSFILKNPNMIYDSYKQKIDLNIDKLNTLLKNKIDLKKVTLNHIKSSFIFTNPSVLYENKKLKLVHIIKQLEAFNPLSVLKRGYSVAYINDNVVRTVKDIKEKDIIKLKISDGIINTTVNFIEEEKNGK